VATIVEDRPVKPLAGTRRVKPLDGGRLEKHPALERLVRVVLALAVFVAIIAIWDFIAHVGFSNQAYLVPTPGEVGSAIKDNFGMFLSATWVTGQDAALGLLLSTAVAVVCALVTSISRYLGDAASPVFVIFQTMPIIAIVPVLLIVFNYSRLSNIIIILIITFFPILSNTLTGLRATNPNHAELFALYRSSRLRALFQLRLPQALPYVFAGLRVAAGLSVAGAILAEWIIGESNGQQSLGEMIFLYNQELKIPLLFAAAVFCMALAVLFYVIVNRVAALTLHRRGAS
jgi:NitT/TauT family transport system permease protein